MTSTTATSEAVVDAGVQMQPPCNRIAAANVVAPLRPSRHVSAKGLINAWSYEASQPRLQQRGMTRGA